LLATAIAIVVASFQGWQRYCIWRDKYHLTPISIKIKGAKSTATVLGRTSYVVGKKLPDDHLWLNWGTGYRNHAGDAGGTGWGVRVEITSTAEEFRCETHDTEFWDPARGGVGPDTKTTIVNSQLSARTSALEITADLVDTEGNLLDSTTRVVTITDVPCG